MLDSIKNILFSTKLTALLLLSFAFSIGLATFIENDYGTPASKALIFNTKWFELIHVLLVINLIGNVIKYKLFRWAKAATLMFHLAFIIIIIGAGITRYISFEGSMHIREEQMSNTIVSSETYLQFKVDDRKQQYKFNKKLYLNPRYNSPFVHEFEFNEKEITVAYKDYIENSIDTVVEVPNGKDILEIVTVGQGGRVSRFIEDGTTKFFGKFPVAFNDNRRKEAIQINKTDSGLYIYSPYDINYLSMDDRSTGVLARDTVHLFQNRRLYSVDDVQLVFKELFTNSVIQKISAPKEVRGEDALVVDVTCNNQKREVTLFGGQGYTSNNTIFQLEELNFSLAYGSISYTTPFSIQLNDFILDKYPGSMSPSSYESEVTLFDNRFGGVEHSQRIYMNNILDYDGYRFFQSSYDQDELGTILSVNHDYWGTLVTYIGYFFLFLGMILVLVVKKSRFRGLQQSIKKLKAKRSLAGALLLGIFTLSSLSSNAADELKPAQEPKDYVVIDKEHAAKFSQLLIQDAGGRLKPINTFASEVLRKVTHKDKFNGLNASQVLLGMMYNNHYWKNEPMIYINRKNKKLQKQLNAKNNYVAFKDFFDEDFKYILEDELNEAMRKKPGDRSKYDDEVINVNERANVCNMVYGGNVLRIFPKINDPNDTWFTSLDYQQFEDKDSLFVQVILMEYFRAINESFNKKDWSIADTTLSYIADYQRKFGASVYPTQSKIDAEVKYNEINIFKKLRDYYALVGLLMLLFLFMDIFKARKWKQITINVMGLALAVLFLLHTGGLIARWYISGHAPWSNGYESVLFISWVTLLAGFIFSRSNKMALAATAILACLLLFVANLNWLNPEITNLVPVLKSYWLMVHVAVITGSYGFLALGSLLGFINMFLMIFKTAKNKDRINDTIKELTFIIELTITVGLFMATIGTFLGGIWANESWGRYWGWDPKETWALVIVLFYAMLLHLRFIPWAKGKFLFNLLAILGVGVVIMTYFGVNYYLSGLHSYAAGDPLPIPTFIPVTLIVIVIVAPIAYFRNKRFKV